MESPQITPMEPEAQTAPTVQPWIAPTFKKVPLSEAASGGNSIYVDGFTYQS